MDAREARQILSELKELESHGPDYSIRDLRDATALADRAEHERDRMAVHRQLEKIGAISDVAIQEPGQTYPYRDVASALLGAGFDRKARPQVVIDSKIALQTKAGSVSGDVEDTNRRLFTGAPLGLDQRYLFSRLRRVTVEGDATGVQSYRQLSRTLPMSPLDAVRAIDDTQTKEEVDTQSEVFTADLKMIAHVQSQTPNILLANPSFRDWVNNDLVAAYRLAVDAHITDEIANAGIGSGGGGGNLFEDIAYTEEVVRAAGYNPDLIVVSPGDGLAIKLLIMSSGDSYAFSQQLPTFVVTTAVADGEGFVADSQALGTLFLGPFAFAAFEENNGTTNSSTVRAESSGMFVVQRPDAAATLSAGS